MARYTEVEVGQRVPFESELLLVHARDSRDTGRPLVIMIHGLQGDGYDTWQSVLQSHWMRTTQSFDVGLVNYASGLKRYRRLVQLSPEDIAARLASEISQLSPRRIVLVGHSMGGLIAKETLQQLDRRYGSASPHTKSVAGIVTLCTPSTGSGWTRLLSLLPGPAWRDRQVLRRHSRIQRDIELFFSTWVEVELHAQKSSKLHVPTFGASAAGDIVVNPMGAELGVPAAQRMTLTGGHSSSLRNTATLRWLESTIASLLAPRVPASVRRVVCSEFNGSAAFPAWESAYRVALSQFIDEHGEGSIADLPASLDGESPDLIVRAYSAHAPQSGVPTEVHDDVTRQERSAGRTALGVSPIGPYAAAAVRQLETHVNAPRLRWFRGVGDNDAEIVAAFREFFDLTTGVARTRATAPSPQLADPWGGLNGGV